LIRKPVPTYRLLLLAVLLMVAPVAGQVPRDKTAQAGWEALQKGDGDGAATAFNEAIKRNPRDAMLQFGAGAAAHLLGRDRDAADSLNRALILDPKLASAAELLGQIEYLQGDLDVAIRRYEQALPFATGDVQTALRKRLDEWRREAAVHENLTERNDARFSVIFDGRSDNFLAGHAVAVLDRAFWRIGEKIGASPSVRILVTLYSEQQFRDITHAPAWSAGAFDGKIRIPVQGVSQNMDQFDRVLVHELTHAMIHGLAPQGVPAWLHEGLASYFEPRDAALAERRIQRSGVVAPLSQLQDGFGRLNAAQAAFAYDESLVATDILTRQLGTRMVVLLQGLASGHSFDQSMGQLGLRGSDFEAQVIRRLKP
jgi:tetratricopeptide (TPR) repeat protein